MSEILNECVIKWMNEKWINKWTNEQMNEWMNEEMI